MGSSLTRQKLMSFLLISLHLKVPPDEREECVCRRIKIQFCIHFVMHNMLHKEMHTLFIIQCIYIPTGNDEDQFLI